MIIINNQEEMKRYYDCKTNTYIFNDDVEFRCNIDVEASIKALEIIARDINAGNIKAKDIVYYAVCFAYEKLVCKSIKGRRENSKHFCLDSEIEFVKE